MSDAHSTTNAAAIDGGEHQGIQLNSEIITDVRPLQSQRFFALSIRCYQSHQNGCAYGGAGLRKSVRNLVTVRPIGAASSASGIYNRRYTPLQPGDIHIRTYNLCVVGFGNVGRAFVALLQRKQQELRERYGIAWRITGVASRRLGWLTAPDGFSIEKLLARRFLRGAGRC